MVSAAVACFLVGAALLGALGLVLVAAVGVANGVINLVKVLAHDDT